MLYGLGRCDNIVSDQVEQHKEIQHVNKALGQRGYPNWTFQTVRKQLDKKEARKEEKKKKRKDKTRNEEKKLNVTIPYVQGFSESLQCVFKRHGVQTTFKPHQTLRQLLVHPKDKRTPQETAGVVYSIPCRDCEKVYVGETARKFGEREKEHKKDTTIVEDRKFTRTQRKASQSIQHQSALTDHMAQHNHVIVWDKVTFPMRETDWKTRGIKEAITIRRAGPRALNRDGGRHHLPAVYNSLLITALPSSIRKH